MKNLSQPIVATLLIASAAMLMGATSVAQERAPAPAAARGAGAPSSAQAMPRGIVPNKAELAISAFGKLDSDNKGYVTPEDVVQLTGFESAFRQADQNRDGRLNASEFNSAWAIYTGNNP